MKAYIESIVIVGLGDESNACFRGAGRWSAESARRQSAARAQRIADARAQHARDIKRWQNGILFDENPLSAQY